MAPGSQGAKEPILKATEALKGPPVVPCRKEAVISDERSPDFAPEADTAAPSVEADAPDVNDLEVGDGSAPNTDSTDWQARFNGLMGRFNRTQNELQAERARLAELEARLQAPTTTEENEPDVADTDAIARLEAQVAALTGMLTEQSQAEARKAILEQHPEVKPLASFITGAEDIETYQALVTQLSEAIKGASGETAVTPVADATVAPEGTAPAESATTSPDAPAVPDVPVTAGGTAFSGEAALEEKVTEAIKNGNFQDYFRAKTEAAEAAIVG